MNIAQHVKVILGIIVLLAVAGGSFYGGMLYGKNQAQAAFTTRGAASDVGQPGAFTGAAPNGTPRGFGQRAAQGGMLIGQIKELGDGNMIVTDTNGKQTQVTVTDTTLIEKQASVTLSDLEIGETVMVSGSQAADGSITARSIQAGAAGRFGMPGGTPTGATP